jgi:hypothetical protein
LNIEYSLPRLKTSEAFTGSPLPLRFRRDLRQGSTFSAASDRRSGQFDRKTDASVAESDTRVRDKDKIEEPNRAGCSNALRNSSTQPETPFFYKTQTVFPRYKKGIHLEFQELPVFLGPFCFLFLKKSHRC